MNTIIAAFKSKNQMMMFNIMLGKKGVETKIIPTPRAVALGCGLSVEMNIEDMEIAKEILKKSKFVAFEGFYRIINDGNKTRVVRMYT